MGRMGIDTQPTAQDFAVLESSVKEIKGWGKDRFDALVDSMSSRYEELNRYLFDAAGPSEIYSEQEWIKALEDAKKRMFSEDGVETPAFVAAALTVISVPHKLIGEIGLLMKENKRVTAVTLLALASLTLFGCGSPGGSAGPDLNGDGVIDVAPTDDNQDGEVRDDIETPTPAPIAPATPTFDAPPGVLPSAPEIAEITTGGGFLDFITVNAEFDDLPPGLNADVPGDNPQVDSTLHDHALTPILAKDVDSGSAFTLFDDADGTTYALPVGEITDPESGEVLKLDSESSTNEVAHFVSEDGKVEQWAIMAVDVSEGKVARQVVSFNEGDSGVMYWVVVDEKTGDIESVMPVIHREEPILNKDGEWVVGEVVVDFEKYDDRWGADVSGERAIFQMQPFGVMAESVNGEPGYNIYVGEDLVWIADEDFHWDPDGIGGYVIDQGGNFYLWDQSLGEYLPSHLISNADIVGGAEVFEVGNKQFIMINDQLELVKDVEAKDGVTTVTLEDGKKLKYEDKDPADDESGVWVEAISEAMQQTNKLIEAYGLEDEVAEGKITVTEVDGVVSVKMKIGEPGEEVEKVVMRSSELGIQHDLEFAVDTVAKNSCESTPEFKPRPNDGLVSQNIFNKLNDYFYNLRNELGYYGGTNFITYVLIERDDEKVCWGQIGDGYNLIYRDGDGVAQQVKLIPVSEEEAWAFATDR